MHTRAISNCRSMTLHYCTVYVNIKYLVLAVYKQQHGPVGEVGHEGQHQDPLHQPSLHTTGLDSSLYHCEVQYNINNNKKDFFRAGCTCLFVSSRRCLCVSSGGLRVKLSSFIFAQSDFYVNVEAS